jgi:hypothetical protein
MAYSALHSFSVFVSVAVKHLTTSDEINYKAISVKYYERETVCVLILQVIRHENRTFSAPHYTAMLACLALSYVFTLHHNRVTVQKKKKKLIYIYILNIKCVF